VNHSHCDIVVTLLSLVFLLALIAPASAAVFARAQENECTSHVIVLNASPHLFIDDRLIGLAILGCDRYVSRDAGRNEGTLVTKPLRLEGSMVTLNARIRGRIQVRLLDVGGNPIDRFGPVTLTGDRIEHPVAWTGSLPALRGVPVRLELRMVQAQLYGIDVK
jgi:hypothetical protein